MSDASEYAVPEQNPDSNPPAGIPAAPKPPVGDGTPRNDRRSRRRALISAPVRVRSVDVTGGGPDDVTTTLDVSRGGVLFTTKVAAFKVGMVVAVTFPYSSSPDAVQAEQCGRVARVGKLPTGRYSVAVVLRSGAGEDLVDSSGRKLEGTCDQPVYAPDLGSKRPLVLVVDKDTAMRDSLKAYLLGEGYDVVALSSSQEAHHVLNMFTPALLIAEIEGEDLPGYELCAHVKGTPRLKTVPVMLMTSSAYPSDYANAHSLGAVVCMAKPFRQERFGHVVRLLVPIRRANEDVAPRRAGDASRGRCSGNATKAPGNSANSRYRLNP